MKQPKHETPGAEGALAATAAYKKAEKVQSSRYEWESRAGEAEAVPKPPAPQSVIPRPATPKSKAARGSLMASLGAWLKKLFFSNRDFFDKDDDATPSPA